MLNALKFIVSLAVAIVLMLIVRAYAFTICTTTSDNLIPGLRRGDKVFVNRLQKSSVGRGDLVVFGDSVLSISRVVAVGGDTIEIGGESFIVTDHCSDGCGCGACRNYLLASDADSVIVTGNEIVGKAYPLKLRMKKE